MIPHSRPTLGDDEAQAAAEVIRSGQVAQGEIVARFEKTMAEYVQRKYAFATSSGLAALHLALIALNIKGHSVILPSYTCSALLYAAIYAGINPAVADVDYDTMNISHSKIAEMITRYRTSGAVIIPHTFNNPVDLKDFRDLGIPIIEDCATAFGGRLNNKSPGYFGDLAVFSFYATKMITTGGEGGMVMTDDEVIAERVKEARGYRNRRFGLRYPYEMTDVQAAVGLVQLDRLPNFVLRRELLSQKYYSLLKHRKDVVLPLFEIASTDYVSSRSFYRFVVRLKSHNAAEVADAMKEKDIMCSAGGYIGLHNQLGLDKKDYPETERLINDVLSLPLYPSLEDDSIEYIVKSLEEVLG